MWPYIYMTKSLRDVLKLFKDQVISLRLWTTATTTTKEQINKDLFWSFKLSYLIYEISSEPRCIYNLWMLFGYETYIFPEKSHKENELMWALQDMNICPLFPWIFSPVSKNKEDWTSLFLVLAFEWLPRDIRICHQIQTNQVCPKEDPLIWCGRPRRAT